KTTAMDLCYHPRVTIPSNNKKERSLAHLRRNYAPLALFALPQGGKSLAPVAIQCSPVPGDGNPIFTPQDGYNWLIAKTTVQIADGNFHEAVSHLGRTHLFIEPFVLA